MDPVPNVDDSQSVTETTANNGNIPDIPTGIESTQTSDQSPPVTQPTPITPEEVEHAYWAEYEEDTTTPDEDEMKEIDGGDSDYSASDRMFCSKIPSFGKVTPG
jgi:hypothetical protein